MGANRANPQLSLFHIPLNHQLFYSVDHALDLLSSIIARSLFLYSFLTLKIFLGSYPILSRHAYMQICFLYAKSASATN